MAISKRFLCTSAALLLMCVGTGLVAGCGGGGKSTASQSSDGVYVTRASEGYYLNDALLLASREAPDGFIPTATASAIQDDLIRIRRQYPGIVEMRGKWSRSLRSLYVSVVNPKGGLAATWSQGKTQTGIAAADALLTRYKVESVQGIYGGNGVFQLQLKDPVNVIKVYSDLNRALNQSSVNVFPVLPLSPNITFEEASVVDLNHTAIARKITDTGRVYVFVRGWGDCAAGCIYAHMRTVTIGNDGIMSMQETNPPPDGNYNR